MTRPATPSSASWSWSRGRVREAARPAAAGHEASWTRATSRPGQAGPGKRPRAFVAGRRRSRSLGVLGGLVGRAHEGRAPPGHQEQEAALPSVAPTATGTTGRPPKHEVAGRAAADAAGRRRPTAREQRRRPPGRPRSARPAPAPRARAPVDRVADPRRRRRGPAARSRPIDLDVVRAARRPRRPPRARRPSASRSLLATWASVQSAPPVRPAPGEPRQQLAAPRPARAVRGPRDRGARRQARFRSRLSRSFRREARARAPRGPSTPWP